MAQRYNNFGTRAESPPLFDLKIVFSYVIEVADSESEFVFTIKFTIIFAFYHSYHLGKGTLKMHFVDQDVVAMYTLHLITPVLILLICNSAPPLEFLRCLCKDAWSRKCIFLKVVKCKYSARNRNSYSIFKLFYIIEGDLKIIKSSKS